MLKPFRLLEPGTLAEAAGELGIRGDAAKVYAGGVELLLLLRSGLVEAEYLIDVKRIPGISDVGWDGSVLRLGAAATHWRIARSPLVQEHCPLLRAATAHLGNVRVRTQGTLGGNLCFADPHADPATALLIHNVSVVLAGKQQTRQMSLREFLVGTYETALNPDELLAEIVVPSLPAAWGTAFSRFEQLHRPTLNVAAGVLMADGKIAEARLAVGCIGPAATRLLDLEERLRGLSVKEAQRAIDGSKPYLISTLDPVDDLLGSAEFKLQVAAAKLRGTLADAAANGIRAGEKE